MTHSLHTTEAARKRLKRRYASETLFRLTGLVALTIAFGFLLFFLVTIVKQGMPAFFQHYLVVQVDLPADIDPDKTGNKAIIGNADFDGILRKSLNLLLPETATGEEQRTLRKLVSSGAAILLRADVMRHPEWIGRTISYKISLDDNADLYLKDSAHVLKLNEGSIARLQDLRQRGAIEKNMSKEFFMLGASREAELAGVFSALIGSLLTLVITLLASFPVGIAAALYLEEFAPKTHFTELIEVNINNLAAVPSIIFGLLGLAVFLNLFGMPRSAPLVGGLVLALMALPIIIIASRAALRSVSPSIKEAALGLGASHMQAVFHHVLPLAAPGILTGTILGTARALGETAPLLLIGMVAFVVEPPKGFFDAATLLPVQIFMWNDFPEAGFQQKTAAAILVMLVFLTVMNLAAVILRRRFERRW